MGHVADSFPQVEIRPGYEYFFKGVQQITAAQPYGEGLGEALRSYAQQFLSTCDLNAFGDFGDDTYRRVHLGCSGETGWEAIMMCWKKGNCTSIHGHPQFAAYNFASGRFRIEIFRLAPAGEPEFVEAVEAGAGQGFFSIGQPQAFDNHIHRITCLSDTGHSLHIYSDDARKGLTY